MNGKVHALPIGKASSLPEENLTKYGFQSFMFSYISKYDSSLNLCYTCYGLDFLMQAGCVLVYSFTGMLAMESSNAFCFWQAGQGVISCV